MGYVVKSPLVQARKADGSYVHVYEGGALPDDVDEAQLKMLVDAGMVADEGSGTRSKRSKSTDAEE